MKKVGVMVVENKEVLIAAAGDYGKFASLIGVGFEGVACGKDCRAEKMGVLVRRRCYVRIGRRGD